jgi:hypothetical protein
MVEASHYTPLTPTHPNKTQHPNNSNIHIYTRKHIYKHTYKHARTHTYIWIQINHHQQDMVEASPRFREWYGSLAPESEKLPLGASSCRVTCVTLYVTCVCDMCVYSFTHAPTYPPHRSIHPCIHPPTTNRVGRVGPHPDPQDACGPLPPP